ncbi:YHS domain-containing (seleno)protein [Marinimicrobium sp. C2-29]|uniref:YHS domain-containing (seleno)protein n=1 Tax=Marinimicrobium sp. C2-29 TaxID=3139825 RepID=UPI00313A1E19
MKKLTHQLLVILLGLGLMAGTAYADDTPVFTGETEGVAIEGYDVVSYFTEGRPAKGSPRYSHEWHGVEWHFASEEHLTMFRKNPERYAPAYGGHCAYGVYVGKKLAASPYFWTIHEGRLYLNLNEEVQESWRGDLAANVETANDNWPDNLE